MFDLKRPCNNCPFLKKTGHNFQLGERRVREIVNASAFQCHKTVDYADGGYGDPGNKPQQCAGLMALLYKERQYNAIMRFAVAVDHIDFSKIESKDVYDSIEEAIEAHGE